MTRQGNWLVAVVGSGDIGADLMAKIRNSDGPLTVAAMASNDIRIIFNTATDADRDNRAELVRAGVRVIDLTPAVTGPWCVPAVNLDDHVDAPYLNMATGDAQATVPIVAAVAQSGIVSYAEIVSSISSAAVGPDIRAAIDNLTQITAAAAQVVGGAQRGKAMLILNPADPPMMMRNTVYCLVAGEADHQRIESDVLAMVDKVRSYIPGYRLKQRIQFETFSMAHPLYIPETGKFTGTRVTVLLEVTGAADYAPAYAGNIDLMTAAAKATAERIAARTAETAGLPT
jgi:acetaldehyde dehydrogenase